MKKICFILTAEFAVRAFLLNHLRSLSQDYHIVLVVNTNTPNFLAELGINVQVVPLSITRKINPISDFVTFVMICQILRDHQFEAVHTLMPKAGLLGSVAAFLFRVPVRIHTFTGQVWANRTGLQRLFLKAVDRMIGRLTTVNLVDGHSQRQYLIDEGVLSASKSKVFLDGSIAGVDLDKFKPDQVKRQQLRSALGITQSGTVFLFIGRLNPEKGLLDLMQAFNRLKGGDVYLLIVGPDESNMHAKLLSICHQDKANKLYFVDYTNEPEAYMAAADVICLPSYREGFNNVVIEAAAVGIPAVASNIYGVVDSIKHQETGLLHALKDIEEISLYMQLLIDDPEKRKLLGRQARENASLRFDANALTDAFTKFYQDVLR